jgi:hypothetical protein
MTDTQRCVTNLQDVAYDQVKQYPQYTRESFNRFNTLVFSKKQIKTKSGIAVEKGIAVILDPSTAHFPESGPFQKIQFVNIWSFNNKVETSVKLKDLRF